MVPAFDEYRRDVLAQSTHPA